MSYYVPVLNGGADSLRRSVEGLLDGGRPDMIAERIAELDTRTRQLGCTATFGAEIEATFIPTNPGREYTSDDAQNMYVYTLDKLIHPADRTKVAPKGAIISPQEYKGIVMRSDYNDGSEFSEQPGVIELQTAPATALEFIERYWAVANGIGSVSAKYGFLAALLSSHFNTVASRLVTQGYPLEFTLKFQMGGKILAAFQHNYQALRALHIDAGLVDGAIVIEEAFPSKHALTAAHLHRIESRQPTVGVADPRLLVLAMLRSIEQVATNTVPKAALAAMRQSRHPDIIDMDKVNPYFMPLIERTVWDQDTKRLVLSGSLGADSVNDSDIAAANVLVSMLTNGAETDHLAHNGLVLRRAVQSLRFTEVESHRWRIDVAPNSPYASSLRSITQGVVLRPQRPCLRSEPRVTLETTASTLRQRTNIKHSATIRGILGSAIKALPMASQALDARRALVDEYMVTG